MILYIFALAIIIAVTVGDFYIFILLGKKALKMSGAKSEIAYIGAYLYLFVTWFAIFIAQGEFQKFIGSTVEYWLIVFAPFIFGLYLSLFLFRKELSIIKNRKL